MEPPRGGEAIARFQVGDLVRVGEGAMVMILTIDRVAGRYLGVGVNQHPDNSVTFGPIWLDIAYAEARLSSGGEYRAFKRMVYEEYRKFCGKMVLLTDVCIRLGLDEEELSIHKMANLPDPLKQVDEDAVPINTRPASTNGRASDGGETGVDGDVQQRIPENTE